MYIADPFGILRGYSTFFILRFSIIECSVDEFQVILLFHCVLFLVSDAVLCGVYTCMWCLLCML